MVLDESQQKFTAERLAVMSKGEIQHIFEDIDKDGSGGISYDEFDFLERYFGDTWDKEKKAKLFEDLDTDENGMIDALEFYDWVIHNVKLTKRDGLGQRTLSVRDQRVKLGVENIPLHLTALLDELGCGGIEQKVTHPLHSAFGRSLRDHFVSSYILAEQWGNPPDVVVAALFHALYQRGDGMQAVKAADMRVPLQERLGKDVEELLYLFPSAHKSAYEPDGLLHAPLGGPVTFKNVLVEGEYLTITQEQRAKLAELEVINSHDQNLLDNVNPVHNLWSFYQHATVLPLLSDEAQHTIEEFARRAHGATCADVYAWHTSRFEGKEMPDNWKRHIEMFAAGGRYSKVEQELLKLGDLDGDGEVDWQEFVVFMGEHFDTDGSLKASATLTRP